MSSDGQLRTDDEIITEMVSVLGFSRRGSRIEAGVRSALQGYRAIIVLKQAYCLMQQLQHHCIVDRTVGKRDSADTVKPKNDPILLGHAERAIKEQQT